MRTLITAILTCLAAEALADEKPAYTLSANDIAKVQTAVRKELLDPDSAQFEGLSAVQSGRGLIAVCGLVNAKNTFGGYAGRKLFHSFIAKDDADPSKETVSATVNSGTGPQMATTLCQVSGVSIVER